MNWKVCQCQFQADTHIGAIVRDYPSAQKPIVVSGDSDLIVTKDVEEFVYPVGKSRTLTLFSKESIIKAMNLPTAWHLVLVAIVTQNDYIVMYISRSTRSPRMPTLYGRLLLILIYWNWTL